MPLASLFPSMPAVRSPRVALRFSRASAGLPCGAASNRGVIPPGIVAVDYETQTVLAAARDFAQSRDVSVHFAIEPRVAALAEPANFRTCLHHLVFAAINRASCGVLVTGARNGDGVEIAVLDDGIAPVQYHAAAVSALQHLLPAGAIMTTEYQPDRGTTVRLRLALAAAAPRPHDVADAAAEELAAFAHD